MDKIKGKDVPFTPGNAFLRAGEEPQFPPRPHLEGQITDADRNTCRWCLEKFDVEKQIKSTPERGYLRTNLFMADNGTELVCCDNCWQGAIGARVWSNGKITPEPPTEVSNPLLRQSMKS